MLIEQLFGKKKLTDSEKQIVDFIEANPRIVINLSLEELSEQCYVSQASIIRLCKKLGTKGFAEFKIRLASELSAFVSRTAFLYVLDCLYGQIFSLNYEKNKENLTNFSQRKMERSYFYNTGRQSNPFD